MKVPTLIVALTLLSASFGQEPDVAKTVDAIKKSKDPEKLEKLALELARSKKPKTQEALVSFLLDPAFLDRLEGEPGHYPFRLEKVLIALAQSRTKKADEIFVVLANDKDVIGGDRPSRARHERRKALVMSSGEFREPSQDLLSFLESSHKLRYPVKPALARMRNAKASELLEKLILDDLRPDVFVYHILPCRNDMHIVAMYARLFQKIKDKRTLDRAVQSLFDYRPKEWYDADDPRPKLPDWNETPSDVLRQVIDVGDQARKLDIPEDTKKSVEKTQERLLKILEERARKEQIARKFREEGGDKKVAAWIGKLDAENGTERDAAERELDKVAEFAKPALEAALANNPSLEARRRLERILNRLAKSEASVPAQK